MSMTIEATTFPTLYKRTSTGKIQMWGIEAWPSDGAYPAMIVTTYGLLDGKKQEAREAITEGKNIGKANETTPYEQAVAEAKSQWEKKSKKSYVQNIEDAQAGKVDTNFITGGVDPMLAKSFDKDGHKITFPAYVQPKLDGHRAIAIIQDGVATLWSRTRKRITGVPHIERELEKLYLGRTIILDGELYNHDYKDRFEELTSFIRQATPKPGHEVVQYWVYDVIEENQDFAYRAEGLGLLKTLMDIQGVEKVVIVDTEEVQDAEEMMRLFQAYMDFGFEGLMVRNAKGLYKGKRSADLQKVKEFQDAEYPVIDITEGKGKMAGKAMFHCVTPEGNEFRVKMVGALSDLETYFNHKEGWIGRQLTVKFQNLSADGIPRFPVAMRFREDV